LTRIDERYEEGDVEIVGDDEIRDDSKLINDNKSARG
jgi:hypothetical protein